MEEADLAGQVLDWVRQDESDTVWLHYMSDGRQFTAACGPRELDRALAAFKWFAEKYTSIDDGLE